MSTARLAEPCRTLPPPCPSLARLINCDSALSAQSAITLARRPQQTGTLRRRRELRAPTSGWRRAGSDVMLGQTNQLWYTWHAVHVGAPGREAPTDAANESRARRAAMGTGTRTCGSASHWRIQKRSWRQGRGFLCAAPRQIPAPPRLTGKKGQGRV